MAEIYGPETALIVIDMLNDFVLEGAPLEVPAARPIVPNIAAEVEKAKAAGSKVIYVCDTHRPDDAEFKTWPKHCVKGTAGDRVVQELEGKHDVLVEKTRYSGFFQTDLERVLQKHRVKAVVLSGILTDICVYFTAADAYMRGYAVTVVKNGVAALSEEEHHWALKQMERLFGARIV